MPGKPRHGMSGTRIYDIWRDMRHRCNCPGMRNYQYYGGRGISVCKEWNDSFEAFLAWAMENGYADNLTIDRKDVNGNYEPSNCRWSGKSVQSANRRSSGVTEYIGVFLHSNGSCYVSSIKQKGKVIFYYSSKSKNDCAKKRNDFIKETKIDYPLNDIKDEFEDLRAHKNDYVYCAKDRSNGDIICKKTERELAEAIGMTKQFIWQCMSGKRNSKRYLFWKEATYDFAI